MLKRLTPFIHYRDLDSGLDFFEIKLGFKVIYREGDPVSMAIVERDNVQLFLLPHTQTGEPFEPAYRIEVDGLGSLFEEISDQGVLHPNSNEISKKPWGAQEFAVLDPENGVCITFYEHKNA